MNKLTKEQAEWILEQIKPSLSSSAQNLYGVITLNDLTEFIYHHCVEKEFPSFNVYSSDKVLLLRIYADENESVRISNNIFDVDMDFDEFKKFTEGCNKIVQWIEAQ